MATRKVTINAMASLVVLLNEKNADMAIPVVKPPIANVANPKML